MINYNRNRRIAWVFALIWPMFGLASLSHFLYGSWWFLPVVGLGAALTLFWGCVCAALLTS